MNLTPGLQVAIRRQAFRPGYGVWVFEERNDGLYIGKPVDITLERAGPAGDAFHLPDNPTLYLRERDMINLRRMVHEQLEGIGVESQAVAKAAELQATKAHLEDMRKLYFHARKVG